MLARLIYVSAAADALSLDDVEGILQCARKKNRLRDISGMLLFDQNAFLQVIEGDAQALTDLYGRIAQDRRHTRLKMLEFREVPQRLFDHWAMGFAGADHGNRQVFMRHTCSSRFAPDELNASKALALLLALGHPATEAAAATPAHAD